MGLLRKLLLSPVTGPLDGTLWMARQINDAAVAEYHDPARLRQALRTMETALLRGEITEAEYDAAEDDILSRLKAST